MKTVSKKLLFASVCLAVLIVAAGTYGYTLYGLVSSLGSQLEDLQREINLLRHLIYSTNPGKTFSFFWQGPIAEKFNVTTFWMNITFERTNETHLNVTIRTNHVRYNETRDYVGVVFDRNLNGEIDRDDWGNRYYADNTFYYGYLGEYSNGQRFIDRIASGGWIGDHRCYFDPQLGCTYVIPVSLEFWHYDQKLKLINDLIHIEYSRTVAVEFCFGMELIA